MASFRWRTSTAERVKRCNCVLLCLVLYCTTEIQAAFTDCGGQLTEQAGVILSPNFPDSYPNDANCNWNITVAPGQIIDFRFKRLDMDRYSDQNCLDFVMIFDGPSTQSIRLGDYYYCGFSDESKILNLILRATSNHMYIRFYSDSRNSRAGFSASYWAHECPPFTYGKEICDTSCICNQTNTQYCVNYNGTCACKSGWTSADCSLDIDECQVSNSCEDPYSACVNQPGGFVCQCKPGMIKNSFGQCQDSNQCTQKKCSHACSVTSENPRTEMCFCPKGMKLDPADNLTCKECDNWMYGDDCILKSECYPPNTKSYNKMNGLCTCYLNWTSSTCKQDVDECALEKKPCSLTEDHAICYNYQGSYKCHCLTGYQFVNETSCDECGKVLMAASGTIVSKYHSPQRYSAMKIAECNWTIQAPVGKVVSLSFQSFQMWYTIDSYFENHPAYIEIYDGPYNNSKLLAIFNGGPYSSTPPGIIRTSGNEMFIILYAAFFNGNYGYSSEGFIASFWSHECQSFTYGANCTQSCTCIQSKTQYCNSTTGQCVCKPGWTSTDCSVDIDECFENPLSCPDYSTCTNTAGSFQCTCKEGLTLDDRKCVVSNGSNVCTTKKCSHVCVVLQQNGVDYEQCYCPIGTELDGNQCVACKNNRYGPDCSKYCGCVQNHTLSCNTRTGDCTCLPQWKGMNCSTDFDVCSDRYSNKECQKNANCTYIAGLIGYRCRCSQQDGYMESTNGSCVPINCTSITTNSTGIIQSPFYPSAYMNNAFCTWSINGNEDNVISLRLEQNFYIEPTYNCPNDYLEIYDGENNETRLIGHYCGWSIPSVIRTRGNKMYIIFKTNWVYSYTGFNGSYTSHACRTFTYGTDSCNNLCRCVKENTEFCDNVNGECICKPGWTLGDCSQDVNECLGTNNKVCPTNSDCINTRGSYRCECRLGYVLNTTSGKCEESKECLYKKCSDGCYVASLGVEKCTCPEGLVLDTLAETVCVVPYYPYGKNASDLLLRDSFTSYYSVHVSSAIYFTFGAPYGKDLHPAAFVLSNGVIGFGSTFLSFGGFHDLIYISNKRLNILAPFMANLNPFQGHVYYHLYETCAGKFSKKAQTSPFMSAIVARAEKNIQEYNHVSSFKVSTVLVVTWAGMQPFVFLNKTSELNTFQALYITGWETENGQVAETAYVIFLYQYGLMNWPYLPGRPIFIGTTGDFENILQDLSTALVSVLDSVPGNTGYKGVMSFKVGHVTGPQQSCKKYLCDHADLLTDPVYQYEKQQLYKCPCTLERLGAQWQLFERRGPKQDIYCYAISMVAKQRLLKDNKRNMLCCYRWTKPANDDWRDWLQSWREATYLPKSPLSGHVLINNPWYLGFFDNYQALENIRAHTLCCRDSHNAGLCRKFYQIFPDMGCSNFVEFVPASALGDPHIKTSDGVTYTMNGLGEYILMEAPSKTFTLQARTGRAETLNGTLSKATVFIAFAAKESNESSFQVELSPSKTSLILLANNIDVTNDFYKESGPDIIMSMTSISVTREYRNNKTLAIVNFPCGVSITVHVAVKSLLIEVNLPKNFGNKTRGLLGNFNGNKNDEFILPDGQLLPANLSERQIYQEFAKKWVVTQSNSVFLYRPGENTSTYQHSDFEPMYKDEASAAQLAEAKTLCGDTNDACIFDYLATGDRAFTFNTKEFSEEMEIVIQNLGNNPPTINVSESSLDIDGRWLVLEGKLSVLKLTTADEDDDSITFEIADSVTGVTVNQSGHILYLPDITKPLALRLRAKDSKGSYSAFLYIPITICPSCSGNGVCNNQSAILEEYENGLFQIQTCNCFPAFTGKNCESELNGCELDPCFKGQTCTDLTVQEQGNSSVGYKCGPCPNGYIDWMQTCVDIDECNGTNPCEQSCTNTEGSYICSCPDGYRLDMSNKKSCNDINECEERTSKCEQKCTNTNGNYTCSCYPGYTVDSNGLTCNLDSSKQTLCYQCQQVCHVSGSNQVNCSCRIGYEVDPKDTSNCRDIDECQYGIKPCSHICDNTMGAYKCSCYTGFKLSKDQISCDACTSPYYGENCANICQCNNRGSCDSVRGCVCNKQWTGVNCEVDVNECDQPNTCPSGYICENTIGSFKCLCPSGYRLENGQCTDINECVEVKNITCDLNLEVCVNTIGSYSCQCKPGYARNKEIICQDINECTSNTNACEQMCENKLGTYNCQCYPGFVLADDRKHCIKVKEECSIKNLSCSYACMTDANNIPVCYCPQGYIVNGLGQCEDINECTSDLLNLCSYKDGCLNTNGSYSCACQSGSKLDNDGRTCLECEGQTWGKDCLNNCSCGTGAAHCDSKTGCICKTGYTGTHCDQDIDECKTGTFACGIKEKCVNIPGSAICECMEGYSKINGHCQDINECSSTNLNNCSQVCTNLEGSFTCSCYTGYIFNTSTHTCSDIDECKLGTSQCEGLCINTDGSYRCSCSDGLFLQPDGVKCAASVPCVNKTDCSYQCANINGTEVCFCPKGSQLASNGRNCIDIDLCATSACKTGCFETKQNTSYECVCPAGQSLNSDGFTCSDCVEGRWGVACNQSCKCLTINTKHCDQVSGKCQCNSEWTGLICDEDVDECLNSAICPAQTHCKNYIGGYTCVCDDGYIAKNSSSLCQECDEGYFGPSCTKKCNCGTNFNCNKTTGSCYCMKGWKGINCDIDINECEIGTHSCNISSHEACLNTEGGYQCQCGTGYNRTCSSCSCEDINECNGAQSSVCDQLCENTNGSFKCSCRSGYIVNPTDSMKCQDLDECSSNQTKCDQICENTVGSYKCSCRPGYIVSNIDSFKCQEILDYNTSVTFDIDVAKRNLEDRNSEDHKKLSGDIEMQMTTKFAGKKFLFYKVIVRALRRGSLIADLTIQATDKNTDSSLRSALQDLISDTFTLDNTSTLLVAASLNGNTIETGTCKAREILNPCQDTEECIQENDVTVCK
ncbi:uncharacterized protein LOC106058961 isoform X2 [Biomphalaria glabrata]|nr:uncharacterized protein LOC106058961 isoform X2 [Biomphalaria glabrata]